jgi:hypothetical protein
MAKEKEKTAIKDAHPKVKISTISFFSPLGVYCYYLLFLYYMETKDLKAIFKTLFFSEKPYFC